MSKGRYNGLAWLGDTLALHSSGNPSRVTSRRLAANSKKERPP